MESQAFASVFFFPIVRRCCLLVVLSGQYNLLLVCDPVVLRPALSCITLQGLVTFAAVWIVFFFQTSVHLLCCVTKQQGFFISAAAINNKARVIASKNGNQ
jgi:hypothetical protein